MQLLIENVSKTYSNDVKALRNVSLEIGNGMFGLVCLAPMELGNQH